MERIPNWVLWIFVGLYFVTAIIAYQYLPPKQVVKTKAETEKSISSALKIGAAMYRTQVLLVNDTIDIAKVDSMFLEHYNKLVIK